MVIGIATSGRTPFTIAAIEYARQRGAQTIALTCNEDSPLQRAAHFAIVTEVGPEVLAGSSRMKAGTAHKMVLNMISTGAMSRLGYVYGNLMVNVQPTNTKLADRAARIIASITGLSRAQAADLLGKAEAVKTAVVMQKLGLDRDEAEARLAAAHGRLKAVLGTRTT